MLSSLLRFKKPMPTFGLGLFWLGRSSHVTFEVLQKYNVALARWLPWWEHHPIHPKRLMLHRSALEPGNS